MPTELHQNLLAHNVDIRHKLQNGRTDFQKKIKFVEEINRQLSQVIIISSELPTNSNVNFEVLNSLLDRFNLKKFHENPFKNKLSKLLRVRNDISHGENSIPVNQEIIKEISFTFIDSMHQLFFNIIEGYNTKSYLR